VQDTDFFFKRDLLCKAPTPPPFFVCSGLRASRRRARKEGGDCLDRPCCAPLNAGLARCEGIEEDRGLSPRPSPARRQAGDLSILTYRSLAVTEDPSSSWSTAGGARPTGLGWYPRPGWPQCYWRNTASSWKGRSSVTETLGNLTSLVKGSLKRREKGRKQGRGVRSSALLASSPWYLLGASYMTF